MSLGLEGCIIGMCDFMDYIGSIIFWIFFNINFIFLMTLLHSKALTTVSDSPDILLKEEVNILSLLVKIWYCGEGKVEYCHDWAGVSVDWGSLNKQAKLKYSFWLVSGSGCRCQPARKPRSSGLPPAARTLFSDNTRAKFNGFQWEIK